MRLLALDSKVSLTAAQISYFAKEIYFDAAEPRLRALHEHIVVTVLVANDHTRAISESYQGRPKFEDLIGLRALQRNVRDLAYADANNELASQIMEAKAVTALRLGNES